ncbi:transmembrane protein 179B isoform X2 [Perognathus longimembris pacificus]|uniref:transmembrane protein 179B isoform X2 n=1 Tax=Perognathus longimembris pacificus TaxID=214514 RepID=UPI0020197502|nr:transmembrane protein 179B isoform X2 [Perognathus longimembris pacificus]
MVLSGLHYVELVLLAAAGICGTVTAASMAWIQVFFRGSCPLYGGIAVMNGPSLALSCPSASSLCYFVTGTNGFLALYCLLLLIICSCIKKSHSDPIQVYTGLTISAIAVFLVLVAACVLRYGTSYLCDSIVSLIHANSCSEAQKIPWTPSGMTLQFYSNLHNAEISSWVNLVLWCVVLVLQIMQCGLKSMEYQPLEPLETNFQSS